MIYIPKKDRAVIREIELAINDELGIDKDTYFSLDRRPTGINRIARLAWIHGVYNGTTLGVVDISNILDRDHSVIVRALAVVRRWMHSKNKYKLERQIIKNIDEKRRTIQRSEQA